MHDVFRAITLSFLIAALYLLLSAAIDLAAIYALDARDLQHTPDENFRLALATASLLASMLCVWVLLVTAFAKRYISRLRPQTTAVAALSVAAPIVILSRTLPLLDPRVSWSPVASLLFTLAWSSLGLHAVLWYLTMDSSTGD
ncbi:MAG: hypothetical protein P8103_11925 [Candidatus Thiodiazotropha sp.]|jgi:hypothetical protein